MNHGLAAVPFYKSILFSALISVNVPKPRCFCSSSLLSSVKYASLKMHLETCKSSLVETGSKRHRISSFSSTISEFFFSIDTFKNF